MGLFSARGRLAQPVGREWPLGRAVRTAIRSTGREMAAGLREARLAAIAATNAARIVAGLLLLAAGDDGQVVAARVPVTGRSFVPKIARKNKSPAAFDGQGGSLGRKGKGTHAHRAA